MSLGQIGVSFIRHAEERWCFTKLHGQIRQLSGLESSELIGNERYQQMIRARDRQRAARTAKEQLEQEGQYQIDYPLTSADGTNRWVRECGMLLPTEDTDEAATEPMLAGFLTDVTAERAAFENLEQQKLFYESTLNTMPLELVVLDAQQRYIFVNETAIRDESLRKWLIGKTDIDYCLFRGKDISVVQGRIDYFRQALTERREVEWEETQVDGQGRSAYSMRRYSPVLGQDGQVKIVMGFGFNITDRRQAELKAQQSEALLRQVTASVQEAIYRCDDQGKILFANEALRQMLGQMLGVEINAHAAPTEAQNEDATMHLPSMLRKKLIPKQGVIESEFELEDGAGQRRVYLVRAQRGDQADSPLTDGAIIDITSLKDIETSLMQKNQELEKAYTELDRFVYSASHDLRAPLTSVMGLVQIMTDELADDTLTPGELADYLLMIRKSVKKLDGFIQDIIHYYRNNRQDVEPSQVNLAELVEESMQSFRFYEQAADLKIVNQVSQTPIVSDPQRLKVILNNLIGNAIKYHDKAGRAGFIHINGQHLEDGHGYQLQIEDNGPGIAEHHQPRLFDMFYRASADSVGSGLGLYIVKEAIDRLGGKVQVRSSLGTGTCFTVWLPSLSQEEL